MPDKAKTLKRSTILMEKATSSLKQEMFELFEEYYDHVTYERFLADLNEKTHVFLFHEKGTNRLVGFSTIYRKKMKSVAPGIFLFSGDTVIHEDYWGSKALQKSFFWFILESKFLSPFSPVYWMLMSKGVKTYLMMRKNFKASYPNKFSKNPDMFDRVLKNFYSLKYPENYLHEKGLILFQEKIGSVKQSLELPTEKIMAHQDAVYFFDVNPNWMEGDELACVAEIRFTDFMFHIVKFFLPFSSPSKTG
jgi:hypothetical protein